VSGRPAGTRTAHPARWLAYLGLPVAAVGGGAFAAGDGTRAALSFLGGLVTALLAVGLGVVLVEVAGRISPALAMVAAVSNYALTVLLFLVLLSAVSPSVVVIAAYATGLAAAVVPYLAWQFDSARPRQ
jgi:hypothetical protein